MNSLAVTFADNIRRYIQHEFVDKLPPALHGDLDAMFQLASTIERQADGVFLWVRLVVGDLLNGVPALL